MSEVIFYGVPQSSYVRTARMTCGEKGVQHKLEPVDFGGEAYRELHPWSKIPSMRHGDLVLYETSAICRYIDEAFDGPALQPSDPAGRAVMEKWISTFNCYVYPNTVRAYALHYVIPRGEDGKPDRTAINEAVPKVKRDFAVLDRAYEGREWLAGDTFSLADIFMAPIVSTVAMFPEGKEVLAGCKNLGRALEAVASRDAYKAALPPMPVP